MVNAAASHGAVRLCYFFLCLHKFLLSTTLSPAYSRLALNVHRCVIIPWLFLVWWCPFLSLPSLDLWPIHVLSSFLILINLVFLFWLQNPPSLFLSLLSPLLSLPLSLLSPLLSLPLSLLLDSSQDRCQGYGWVGCDGFSAWSIGHHSSYTSESWPSVWVLAGSVWSKVKERREGRERREGGRERGEGGREGEGRKGGEVRWK